MGRCNFIEPSPPVRVPCLLLFLFYFFSEGVSVPANAAAEGKLFPSGRVADVQRALFACQLDGLRADGALRQFGLGHVGDPLEVVVAGVAEVSRAEAEEDGDGAAVAALVLEVVGAVLRAHLRAGHVGTAAADKLLLQEEVK